MKNLEKTLERIADNHQVYLEDDTYILTMSAFLNLREVVKNSDIELKEDDGDQNTFTLTHGNDTIKGRVEKQVHQKVDKTYKVCGEKIGRKFIKVNFVNTKEVYEIWTNLPDLAIGRNGQPIKQKMVMRDKSKQKVMKKYREIIKAHQAEAKEA